MRQFINILEAALNDHDDQTEFPFLKDFKKHKEEKNSEQHQKNLQANDERLQRARDLGFDVDDPHYFGTPNGDFDEMDLDRTSDENLAYGRGAYNTRDPSAASGYSKPGASWGNKTDEPSPTVYKVFLKVKNPFNLNKSYPYSEVKRIFTHCYSNDELKHIEFFTDLAKEANDYKYFPENDDDNNEYSEPSELEELDNELFNVDQMSAEELGIDPEDYDDGEDDVDYKNDIEEAIEKEKQHIQRQIDRINKREEDERESVKKAVEDGRLASVYGKDIYRALWQNSDDYKDWEQESQLIGGESDTFEFKTVANRWLEELGYDGIRHTDNYNPGNPKTPHVVTIAFQPHQVRSVHANFDPQKNDSPKLSEMRKLINKVR